MKLSRINLAAPALADVTVNGYGVLERTRLHGCVVKVTKTHLSLSCMNPGDPDKAVKFRFTRTDGEHESGRRECFCGMYGHRIWPVHLAAIEAEIAAQMAGTSEFNHPMQDRP